MNEKERTTVAYNESGHALVAELVPHGEPVSKISIVPHSRGALMEQYDRAQSLLKRHHAAHTTLAQQLLKQETVTGNDVEQALAKNPGENSPEETAHLAELAKA